MNPIRRETGPVRSLLGDKIVQLVFLTRFVTTASAPITLYLVAALRPPAEQGFYFVFTNLQAVAVLFEFGIGTMLVQFAAHVTSSLKWTVGGELSGAASQVELARAVLQYARRWFATAAGFVVAVVLPAGFWMFHAGRTKVQVQYSIPWIVATGALGAYLTIVPILCFLEGSGHLRRVQQMRLLQAVASVLCLWILVPALGSLYAVAVASVVTLVIAYTWLRRFSPELANLTTASVKAPTGWLLEGRAMFAAQGRSAVAWIVAFLGPQLLTPIVFWQNGPEPAGQVGLTLAAASAPLMLAVSWLHARYPEYGGLAARKDLAALDATAGRATSQAAVVFFGGTAALLAFVLLIKRLAPALWDRFLPLSALGALCASSFAYLLYQAMAARLRAHREEPLYLPAVLGSIIAIICAMTGARRGAVAAAMAYSGGVLFAFLPLATIAFVRKRSSLRSNR